jgi:hypothetical protein
MGFAAIGISHLSLQYIGIPVRASTLALAPHDPTSDTVQMAFMPQATQSPQVSDWKAAIWSAVPSNIVYPYAAYCLVGPGGTVDPGIGTFYIWLKVTDNPEIPAGVVGQLQIS